MNNYLIYLTAITATIFILLSSTAQAADIPVTTSPFCPNSTSTDRYIINTNVIFNCTAPVNINVTGSNYAIFVNDSYTLDMNGTVLFGNNDGIGIQLGNNSILKNGIIRNYDTGVFLNNSINNTISNNTIQNNYYGIYFSSSSNNTISNNTVSNNTDTGIYLDSGSNNTITNNIVNNNSNYGFYLYSSSNNTISNNTVTNNTDTGIYLGSGSDNTITNNIVNNNSYNGFYIDSTSNNIISNNTISNNNEYGIYFYSGSNNTIINNIINNNSNYGIWLEFTSNNIISNNTVSNNANTGIYFYSGSDNTITNNIVNNNSNYGIYLYFSSNNNHLTNNTVYNNQNGIYFLSSSNNNLTSNTANNNNYGIWLQDSNYTTLTNNIANNNVYGIYLYSSSGRNNDNNNNLTNNTANNNTYGIYLQSSSSNILTNNTANNNEYGVYLYYRARDNNLINNIVNNNNYGIRLEYSIFNTLTNNTANNNNNGIWLEYSDFNTLADNTAQENEEYDLFVSAYTEADCNNLIENTTGSGGRPILYYNNSVTLQNQVLSELILCNADNSNITNVTIDASPTLKNNGLFALLVDGSNLTGINSSNNYYGIYLLSSNNNILTSNTLSNNTNDGIYLYSGSNNTISNNTANNNKYGIYFYNSQNNTLIGNTILNSLESDFYVDIDSTDNIIHNTTLNNSIISFTGMGISLKSSSPIGSAPAGYRSLGKHVNITNLRDAGSWIFLNITYSDTDVIGMNESKLSIWRYNSSAWNNWTGVNGVNTAGKYVYANLTNFSIFDVFGLDDIAPTITIASPTSTTYTSNSVALEVSANEPVSAWWYSLDGGPNTRFTPNTTLSGLSNGLHTLIVYADDSVGNIGTGSVKFIVNVYSSYLCRLFGKCRGANVTTNITKETKIIAVIAANATTNLTITNAASLGIKIISISVKNTVNNVQLTISKTTHPTGAIEVISPLKGKVYKYIEITKFNIQDEDVSSLIISIQVEKSWLADNNIDEDKVALYRYDSSSNTWTKLITTKTTSDENYVYYNAQSPGLSIFAIASELKQAAAPEPQPSVPQETQPSAPAAPTDYTWLIIIVAIIIIAGTGYYLYSQGFFGKKKRR